jgi:hypothetical protein
LLRGFLMMNSSVGAVLIPIITFGLYTALGYTLTPAVAFPALALFNLIRLPLSGFPEQLGNIVAAEVRMQGGWTKAVRAPENPRSTAPRAV